MIAQTYVSFSAPITLRLAPLSSARAGRVPADYEEFSELPLVLQIDALQRTLTAHLPPVPGGILLYGPEDFAAACPDSMDEHAARVLQLLGSDPAAALQALIDGEEMPAPPQRVPREIANWRAKAVLANMGKLAAVESLISAMPEPGATVLRLAWTGNAALLRTSQTVAALAASLGMSDADVDAFFISAGAIIL